MLTDSLTAVDVHVRIEADSHGHYSLDDELMAASARYFRADHDRTPTLPRIAEMYRSLSMAAVVFTVDAGMQGLSPDAQAYYPLWAEIESLGVPALFHTGQTGIGAGLPGGRGIKLRLSDDAARRCGRGLPVADGDPRAPVGAVGGRVDLDGDAQVE